MSSMDLAKGQAKSFARYGLTPPVPTKSNITKSPNPEGYSPSMLKKLPCRYPACKEILAGSSNRRRHERKQHPDFIPEARQEDGDKSVIDITTEGETQQERMSERSDSLIENATVPVNTVEEHAKGPSEAPQSESPNSSPQIGDSPKSMPALATPVSELPSPVSAATIASNNSDADDDSAMMIEESIIMVSGEASQEAILVNQPGVESQPRADTPRPALHDESSTASFEHVSGVPPMISEDALAQGTNRFMKWLSEPPMTPMEQIVKARRATTESQLAPIRSQLRFVFKELYEKGLVKSYSGTPDLEIFMQVEPCQAFRTRLQDRQVRGERMYQLFLLIKKILVFLASEQSVRTRQFFVPAMYPSFAFVDSVCVESSSERKAANMNRYLLGQSDPTKKRKFEATSKPVGDTAATNSEGVTGSAAPPAKTAAERAANAYASAPIGFEESHSSNQTSNRAPIDPDAVLTMDEMRVVATGCLSVMKELKASFEQRPNEERLQNMTDNYTGCLVTAIFAMALSPRTQVLRCLEIEKNFRKYTDDKTRQERYWMEIPADQQKNRKPTRNALPLELTSLVDFYIDVIRPAILRKAFAARAVPVEKLQHLFLFCKRNGAGPRTDFARFTKSVTLSLIQRAVNPHAFRHGTITGFYEMGATQSEMNNLATMMAHDACTAKNYYFRPQMARAVLETSDRMTTQLLHGGRPSVGEYVPPSFPPQSSNWWSESSNSMLDGQAFKRLKAY